MPAADTKFNHRGVGAAYYLSEQQRARIKLLSRSWVWRLELPTWILIGVIYTGWFACVIYWQQLGIVLGSILLIPVLSHHRRMFYASPAYLVRNGVPQTPAQLVNHQSVLYQRNGRIYNQWRLMRQDDIQEVTMSGEYISDDGEIARRWALVGLGIANKAVIDVIEDIRAGRLVQVLPGWQGEVLPLNLLCPHRSQVSERVRGLQTFLQQRCREWMGTYGDS